MLVQLIIWYVGLSLHEELLQNHVDHEQKVLMNVCANVLKFYLKLLEKTWNEDSNQGTCQYLRYLKLSDKEHHS